MAQHGTWISYGGTARVALALVLLIAAGSVAYAGTRLPLPVRAPRPGRIPESALGEFIAAGAVPPLTAASVSMGIRTVA
jgi:hypothetical protein